MGLNVENLNLDIHRAEGSTGLNDNVLKDHRGDAGRDSTSPKLDPGDLTLLYRCARDGQKSQGDFDTLGNSLGNGVGAWYSSRVTAYKTTLRSQLQNMPPEPGY